MFEPFPGMCQGVTNILTTPTGVFYDNAELEHVSLDGSEIKILELDADLEYSENSVYQDGYVYKTNLYGGDREELGIWRFRVD